MGWGGAVGVGEGLGVGTPDVSGTGVAAGVVVGATGSGPCAAVGGTSVVADGADKLVSASEVQAARVQAQLAQTHAVAAVEEFRAGYPTSALKFDYTFHDEKPFDVSAIYHDDKFTYIKSSASEKFSIYELKDGKPDLITFQLKDGTYILPTIVDKGYLEIGKHKLTFERKGQ